MNIEKSLFLETFKNLLENDDINLDFDTRFEDIEGWDSLTTMLIITEFNEKYDKSLDVDKLAQMKTVSQIYHFYND